MSNAIITFKVMPESPEVDMEAIKAQALEIATGHGAKGEMQSKVEPLAFGLKQLLIYAMFEVSDDKDFDEVSADITKLDGVQSTEIINMDLAMG